MVYESCVCVCVGNTTDEVSNGSGGGVNGAPSLEGSLQHYLQSA